MINIYAIQYENINLDRIVFEKLPNKILKDLEKRLKEVTASTKRKRIVIGDLFTKFIVGRELRLNMSDVVIKYGMYGKPYLDGSLHFNISHTNQYIACAINTKEEVGIDISKIRECIPEIIKPYLKDMEYEYFLKLPCRLRSELLHKIWSLNESYCKLDGRGLLLQNQLQFTLEEFESIKANRWIIKNDVFLRTVEFISSHAMAISSPEKGDISKIYIVDEIQFLKDLV